MQCSTRGLWGPPRQIWWREEAQMTACNGSVWGSGDGVVIGTAWGFCTWVGEFAQFLYYPDISTAPDLPRIRSDRHTTHAWAGSITIWYGVGKYGMSWYGMLWHGKIGYDLICSDMLCDVTWYNLIPGIYYDIIWYDMILYGMVWCGM